MAQTLGGQFDLHARLIWEHAIDAIDDLRERTQSVFETQYELLPFRPIDFFERLNGTFDTYNVSKPSHLSNAKSSVPGKVSAARATIRDLKSNSSLQGKNATGKKQLPAVLAFLWDYHPETAQEFYKYVADQMPDQYADTFRRFANASVHEIGAAPTTENDNDSAKKEYLEKDAKQNAKRFTGAWWIAGAVILLSLIGSGILLGPSILGDDQIEIPEDDAQVDNVSQVSGTWDEITEAQWAAAPNSYFKTIARRTPKADVEAAAASGDADAMTLAAFGHFYGLYSQYDHGLAIRDFLTPACEADHGRACTLLGRHYTWGWVVPADNARSQDFHRKACRLGNAVGCFFVEHQRYRQNVGNDQIRSRALARLKSYCDLGEVESCYAVGHFYEYGNGVPKDLSIASLYYKKSCEIHPWYCVIEDQD